MKSLNIAILSYRSAPFGGGQGVYVRDLSDALKKIGHKVTIISGPPYPHLPEDTKLIKLPGMNLFETFNFKDRLKKFIASKKNFINIFEFFSTLFGGFPELQTFGYRANKFLKNGDYDIVLDNQSISYGMLELQKQFPFIEIIHHPITKDLKFELSQNNKFLYQLSRKRWHSFLKMQKRVAPKLNKIITVSHNSKKDIVEDFKVSDKSISVINNGLDTTIFRLIEKDIFKNNYQLITTASADVPLKGLDYTLYALSSLKKTYPEILLNIIGKLKKNGHTERLIEKLDIKNNIRFHSGISKEEIVHLYSKSSIAIVSSLYEGFGYPVIEAMACGVPLIATKTASIPELVSDKALLVQPKNHDEIAAGINKIFNDYEGYKKKAISNITYIKERFNWDVIALEYNKIISETITNFKK